MPWWKSCKISRCKLLIFLGSLRMLRPSQLSKLWKDLNIWSKRVKTFRSRSRRLMLKINQLKVSYRKLLLKWLRVKFYQRLKFLLNPQKYFLKIYLRTFSPPMSNLKKEFKIRNLMKTKFCFLKKLSFKLNHLSQSSLKKMRQLSGKMNQFQFQLLPQPPLSKMNKTLLYK